MLVSYSIQSQEAVLLTDEMGQHPLGAYNECKEEQEFNGLVDLS